jgi:hypothetical protein
MDSNRPRLEDRYLYIYFRCNILISFFQHNNPPLKMLQYIYTAHIIAIFQTWKSTTNVQRTRPQYARTVNEIETIEQKAKTTGKLK